MSSKKMAMRVVALALIKADGDLDETVGFVASLVSGETGDHLSFGGRGQGVDQPQELGAQEEGGPTHQPKEGRG